MKLFLIGILTLVVSLFGNSQTYNGMFGKKNILQLEAGFCIPLISNIYDESDYGSYQKKGSKLVEKKDNFDIKGQVSLIHYFTKGFGLGFSASYGVFTLSQPTHIAHSSNETYDTYSITMKHELIDVSQFQIMPRIEFGNANGLLPIGIAHQIGLGYTKYTLQDKTYAYEGTLSGNKYTTADIPATTTNEKYYNFKRDSEFNGVTFLYGVTMRLPVSKRILFIYNLQYTLNFVGFNLDDIFQENGSSNGYLISRDKQAEGLRNDQLKSILKMGAGFAFTF